jgi:CheY-like chemotaxis protein
MVAIELRHRSHASARRAKSPEKPLTMLHPVGPALCATVHHYPGSLTIIPTSQEEPTPTIRVLLAEDFRPYRALVASLLSQESAVQVIGEASDGLEIVEKAQQLRPDLIFMDIGLPNLNGLEAARRIHDLNPSAKIVFLTQETDIDVVEEAFSLGACGYVLKQQVETELRPALAAVLQGRRFVSSGLPVDGFGLTTGLDETDYS